MQHANLPGEQRTPDVQDEAIVTGLGLSGTLAAGEAKLVRCRHSTGRGADASQACSD